jgi:hypothetical protein
MKLTVSAIEKAAASQNGKSHLAEEKHWIELPT